MHPTITSVTQTVGTTGTERYDKLQVVRLAPMNGHSSDSPLPLVPLGVALKHTFATVSEMANETVRTVKIENHSSDFFITGIAGEIITGGYQDRLLNVSIIIPPLERVEVPVSCVERSRWSPQPIYATPQPVSTSRAEAGVYAPVNRDEQSHRRFRTGQQVASSAVRTAAHNTVIRSVTSSGQRTTDQLRIWETVDHTLAGVGARSRTSTLRAAYATRHQVLAEVSSRLQPAPGQVGVAVFWGAELRSFDLFGTWNLLTHYHDQLVQSAALDVGGEDGPGSAPEDQVVSMMESLAVARILKEQPVVGDFKGGSQLWLQGQGTVATALIYEQTLVHLVVSSQTRDSAGVGAYARW